MAGVDILDLKFLVCMLIVLGLVRGTEVFGIGDQVDHWSVIPSGEGVWFATKC